MAICRERGVVVYSQDINETDRVISLAGEQFPRQNFIFKGIRKSKRRPIAATELGSYIELDFYNQPNKDWKSVKEFQLINRFDTLKGSYPTSNFIVYACEFIHSIYPEAESHPFLFQLLSGSFEHSEKLGFQFEILPFLKIRALTHMGHFPSEFHCHSCGEEILSKMKAFFSVESREFLCGDCHSLQKDHLPLLKLFATMLTRKFSNMGPVPLAVSSQSDQLLNQLVRSILGRELKSYFEFYKSLGKI
ncbi:MAG: DNA repair protein RecO [Leptospira sp.]|nr:DNA repair protein RecO [Leptospira sp.]